MSRFLPPERMKATIEFPAQKLLKTKRRFKRFTCCDQPSACDPRAGAPSRQVWMKSLELCSWKEREKRKIKGSRVLFESPAWISEIVKGFRLA